MCQLKRMLRLYPVLFYVLVNAKLPLKTMSHDDNESSLLQPANIHTRNRMVRGAGRKPPKYNQKEIDEERARKESEARENIKKIINSDLTDPPENNHTENAFLNSTFSTLLNFSNIKNL